MNIRNVYTLFAVVLLLIIAGCAQPGKRGRRAIQPEVHTFRYIEGTVDSTEGNEGTIRFALPVIDTSTLPFTNRVTQKVINKSFLLENGETRIGNQTVKVVEIRGDLLTVQFEEPPTLNVGDLVKIFVPKKILAITDFEVIRGHDKTIGTLTMESLTTAMVNSGQFNVVERHKLKTLFDELKIGLTGLSDSKKAKQLGELLQADLILTGTFANLGSYWNVNLRLINVSTGLIVVAFEEKALFSEIKPDAVRDIENINASFEDRFNSYNFALGETTQRNGAYRKVFTDRSDGANHTSASICMKYRLSERGSAVLWNQKARDLSLFSGISFYAKADHEIYAAFAVRDSNIDDPNKTDVYRKIFPVETSWREYRIYFSNLGRSVRHARQNPEADGILLLDRIESLIFAVGTNQNPSRSKGKICVDEIYFF
jgi:TolB-like protein